MGFQTTGTASEYFAVDASKVTPIPEDMSYEEGAMIEPLAVAVHGVKQMGDVAGMNIAVLGAGPIGNLVAQTAKGMGAAKVMITDISDLRLAKAKECGIDVCVNTKNTQMLFLSSEIPLLLIPHRDYTFHDDMDSNVHNIPAALSSLSVQHETL